jgi:hypothetical protein
MKVLTIKNLLKLAASVVAATVFSAQAFAGDIALTGTYGNYMQPGCGWVFGSSNNYGPNNVPSGATTNGVNVTTHYLNCAGATGPQAVKVVVTHYTFTVPYWDSRIQTGQTCSINSAQATAVGNCDSYRVYN